MDDPKQQLEAFLTEAGLDEDGKQLWWEILHTETEIKDFIDQYRQDTKALAVTTILLLNRMRTGTTKVKEVTNNEKDLLKALIQAEILPTQS